ncbi:hypothetical protein CLHUN_18780 [Ruminiclostridium hungatei]|uniref:Uncharacterized protein n=1 Tax=Ruminiclostridium hungatei TaxID=48256 RepID=A0A1V4SJL2_RUMHU|nr:hypothetical protein [Ruminiclostridium hungatei]OPX44082.1 hypothetical protein CLHUN_18780 [Ruminiclostridium hungatei]
MKRFIFGLIIFLFGAVIFVFNYIDAVLNPCNFNGIGGLKGAFLGRGTLDITVISVVVLLVGLGICGFEAFRKRDCEKFSVKAFCDRIKHRRLLNYGKTEKNTWDE